MEKRPSFNKQNQGRQSPAIMKKKHIGNRQQVGRHWDWVYNILRNDRVYKVEKKIAEEKKPEAGVWTGRGHPRGKKIDLVSNLDRCDRDIFHLWVRRKNDSILEFKLNRFFPISVLSINVRLGFYIRRRRRRRCRSRRRRRRFQEPVFPSKVSRGQS